MLFINWESRQFNAENSYIPIIRVKEDSSSTSIIIARKANNCSGMKE